MKSDGSEEVTVDGKTSVSASGVSDKPDVPDHDLVRVIGRGAYGTVWLARNVMGNFRAVKVVYRETFPDDHPYEREYGGIKKFEPISRTHEGFVDILHIGRNDAKGCFYYVMELGDDQEQGQTVVPETYQAKTLATERHRRGRFPFEESLQIGLSLASALDQLHKHGLIHRDIKPSNIIFVNGVPKLADIGLVTELDTQSIPGGTIGYIAPEGVPSPRADIFSLGMVLYELNTGIDRLQFPGLPTIPQDSSEWNRLIEMNAVVLRACAREPERRYPTAAALHSDLVLLQAGKSIERLRRLERRLALWKRIGVAALAVSLLGAAVHFVINRELQRRAENRERQISQYVAQGTRAVEEGDFLGALPWFTEALNLSQGNPLREEPHRIRLATALRQCPTIVQAFFEDAPVTHVDFSPDGRRAVTVGYDGTASIWQIGSGTRESRLAGHTGDVESCAFSPDGRLIVTAGSDRTTRVWDAISGQPTGQPLRHSNTVYSAQFSRDGAFIVTACDDKSAAVWNVATGERLRRFPHDQSVWHASFSPDGSRIVTATAGGLARGAAQMWNVQTGQPIGPPMPHESWVYHASFSPDGRHVVSCSFDHNACLWDASSGQKLRTMTHPAPVRSAHFSRDGRLLVFSCWDYTVRVCHVADGEAFGPPLKHSGNVMHAAFHPTENWILTASRDQMARLWQFPAHPWRPTPTRTEYSGNGRRFLAFSNDFIQVCETVAGKSPGPTLRLPPEFSQAVLNHDGSRLLLLSSNSAAAGTTRAQLVDGSTGQWLAGAFDIPSSMSHPTLGPNGQRLAFASGRNLHVWDPWAARAIAPPQRCAGSIQAISFDPSGRRAVVAGGTNAVVFSAANGSVLFSLPHHRSVRYAEFSPDERYLITACQDGSLDECAAQMWDARTGQKVGPPLEHRDGVNKATFSPDTRLIVTASEDRTGQIWAVPSGQRLGPPLRHNDEVTDACFNPEGRYVLTACRDGTARVWDARTSEPLTPPLRHPWRSVVAARFVADGREILTRRTSGDTCLTPLPRDTRSVQDLTLLAQFLSGYQSLPSGTTHPLTKDLLHRRWEQLRTMEDFQRR